MNFCFAGISTVFVFVDTYVVVVRTDYNGIFLAVIAESVDVVSLGFQYINVANQGDGCHWELTRLIAKENRYAQGFLVAFKIPTGGDKTGVRFDKNNSHSTALGGFSDFVWNFRDL